MKKSRIQEIINEEITNVKWGRDIPLNESIGPDEEREIRDIIRSEVAAIFFTLFKRRKSWGV